MKSKSENTKPTAPSSVLIEVSEVFASIQGEATYAGTPSIFIRLQGCAVGCPWCDTKYTWDFGVAPQYADPHRLALAEQRQVTWATSRNIVLDIVHHFPDVGHIVITGGEPCINDLYAVTKWFREYGRTVQIETSGTEPIRVTPGTWITLSPKIGMPGGKEVLSDSVARADEIKMPIGKTEDIRKLYDFLIRFDVPKTTPVWLQPLADEHRPSSKAVEVCVEAAMSSGLDRPFKISAQVHKALGLR